MVSSSPLRIGALSLFIQITMLSNKRDPTSNGGPESVNCELTSPCFCPAWVIVLLLFCYNSNEEYRDTEGDRRWDRHVDLPSALWTPTAIHSLLDGNNTHIGCTQVLFLRI